MIWDSVQCHPAFPGQELYVYCGIWVYHTVCAVSSVGGVLFWDDVESWLANASLYVPNAA